MAVLVADIEILEGLHPVAAHCGREDNQYAGAVAVGSDETLCYHGGDYRLAQTDHVGDKASAMTHHDVVALHYSITLIGEIVVAVGQQGDKIILHLSAKMVNQHPHIKLVGGRLLLVRCKVGLIDNPAHIVEGDRQPLIPQPLKLALAIVHIVVVLHSHIELISGWLGGTESLGAEVAAAHNHPTVAVGIVPLGQTEVELGVQVARRVST